MPKVVVGYDGPEMSGGAVKVGAAEARVRGVPLRLVTVWGPPFMDMGTGYPVPVETEVLDAITQRSQELVDKAVQQVRIDYPDVAVSGEVVMGAPTDALLDESDSAELVVVGTRGRGGHRGMALGSVSRAVAEHASCPVLVVRTEPPLAAQRVVVGVDGSECSQIAVDLAFDWAQRHRLALHVVHAWTQKSHIPAVESVPQGGQVIPLSQIKDAEIRATAEVLAGRMAQFPDVVVTQEAVQGSPATTLIDASGNAVLVVVGSRGRGGFKRLLLGSTSHQVITHALCSVCVVH